MADFGFVGPAYTAASPYQDCQELINWFLEKDPLKADGQRGQYTMYPTPGLTTKLVPGVVAEVRGMRSVQAGTVLFAVIGNTVYTISSTFVATAVGTIPSSAGPIQITDNGAAAYFCDGANRYSFTYATNTLATVTDGGFTGGSCADVVDNIIVYNQPGTQNWGATQPNSTASNALSVGKKDGSPDALVRIVVNAREVFLLGEYTTEMWTDVGAFPFAFSRVPGTSSQHGCAAKDSVARVGNSFAYVAQDRNGQGLIVVMNGYGPQEISNHAVTQTLQNQVISDAVGWSYQLEGHEFYVVTFPTIDLTWVYDASTEEWHKWLSVDSFDVYHRNRVQCQALFQGLVLVGDYANGTIYVLDNNVYTEAGAAVKRLRRAPHLVDDFKQTFYESLQIQFQPGVGLSVGQGSDPQAMLRWSNDGGSTYSNQHWRSIGKTGKYKNRCVWRKLGTARDRVFELTFSDPVKAVVVSAELKASPGDN